MPEPHPSRNPDPSGHEGCSVPGPTTGLTADAPTQAFLSAPPRPEPAPESHVHRI